MRVDQCAVAPDEFLGADAPLAQRVAEVVARTGRPSRRRAIPLAHEHVADALFQFSDVAGPRVVGAEVPIDAGQHLVGQVGSFVRTHHPLADEHHQVAQLAGGVAKLVAKRRGHDQIRAEPVVEVLAEPSGAHFGLEIAIGRGDQLALEVAWRCLADALKLARLQHPQQLDLDRRVDLANLVEQHGTERRTRFQPADAVLQRPGERAFPVPEQLRLDERRRQRRQIQRVEGPVEIGDERFAVGVERNVARKRDGPGHQFLARARGSGHQRGDIVHPAEERALVASHVVREDRLPHGGAQVGRGTRPADKMTVDEVEGAADLVETGKQVRGVPAARQADPVNRQVVPHVAAEALVAREPAPAARGVDVNLVQLIRVAQIQRGDHDVGVECKLSGGRGPRAEQPLPDVARHPLRDGAQLLHGRVIRVGPQTPDRAVRHVFRAEHRAFQVDELRVERVAVGQTRQRFDGLMLVGPEQWHAGTR